MCNYVVFDYIVDNKEHVHTNIILTIVLFRHTTLNIMPQHHILLSVILISK